MSTKKSRDLAQELVDFLLKEEKQTGAKGVTPAVANGKKENKIKPQLVSPFPAQQATNRAEENPDKTIQIDELEPSFISSIDVRLPDAHKTDPRYPEAQKVDLDKTELQKADPPQALRLTEDEGDSEESPGKMPLPASAKLGENSDVGFTAIEFNIKGQDVTEQGDVNFLGSSEKAKEILSEVTQIPKASSNSLGHLPGNSRNFSGSSGDSRVIAKSDSDLIKKSELKANVPKPLEPHESTHSGKSQAFSTQRSRIVVNEVTQLMAGAEAVKVAQARISSLERERDELRSESEELLSTTETLQRRFNELKAQHDTLERKHKERIEILEDEKAVIRTRLSAREEELDRVKKENEDLQLRFKNDLRKIRVRERELEHRQEIMKAEHATVVQSKDEMIIELKRTLEKLHFELDNFRAKSADMNTKINEFYERNHRTVKALRLALSVLETGDNEDKPKKATG